MTGLMQGKRGLIMGLANDKSLAWGIAKKLHEQGAELAFSYQGEALEKRVPAGGQPWQRFPDRLRRVGHGRAGRLLRHAEGALGTIDFIVHAIGYSDKPAARPLLRHHARQLPDDDEHLGLFAGGVTKRARPMMAQGGSILTLTYGAEKVVPHYNVMGVAKAALETSVKYLANDCGPEGIRVNAISAGPIKTLAASGIGDFAIS
jgi:enoyl-[acyl-carrier protein] reductase I